MSAVPGRVRLRAVTPSGRDKLASLADALGTSPDVRSVELRAKAASLVLRFDPDRATAVADGLLELGVDLRALGAAPAAADPEAVIAAAAARANRAVARRLDGTDLRVLVPLGLGLLAARRAVRGEERLADAPWYVLAWYASETFSKFHGGGKAPQGVGDREEQ